AALPSSIVPCPPHIERTRRVPSALVYFLDLHPYPLTVSPIAQRSHRLRSTFPSTCTPKVDTRTLARHLPSLPNHSPTSSSSHLPAPLQRARRISPPRETCP